jgi:hypothetical protein
MRKNHTLHSANMCFANTKHFQTKSKAFTFAGIRVDREYGGFWLMHAIARISVMAAAIMIYTAPSQALAANDACPFGYNASGYSYACFNDHRVRHCGCWSNDAFPVCSRGTQLICRHGLFGNRYCACD